MCSILIRFCGLTFVFIFLSGCVQKEEELGVEEIKIIPLPVSIKTVEAGFKIKNETTFNSSESFGFSNRLFSDLIRRTTEISLRKVDEMEQADIVFRLDSTLPANGYHLKVSADRILLEGGDEQGVFYGVQSLRQLLPAELEGLNGIQTSVMEIPGVEITDFPRFSYRGMHLDVGRHFFPKEFIKEYIDYLAMLKMNYFHWHLTEDQGWRIEIKQYPRLMTHAAYRNETLVGHYNDQPQQFDGKRYGGYYTQDEIREIVKYAQDRHITIIPEIEMPGHAQAAVSAYPELGCTGEQVEVATKWGVFENIYCPNEETFAFLEGVLAEVIDLFPGPYIHIGGDEAPKTQWKACSHCQRLIKKHGLNDENELQSWFIWRIEKFVNSKGKMIIGWDEILEGGLAPNATVMSWRGTKGGVEAAREGHDVIMTPTSHAYFDYYQSDDPNEPLAIGGYLPLKKVYSFNPVPDELSAEESRHILGAQGNVWTEYMKTPEKVQYMVFPRILAMSEVLWSGPSNKSDSSYIGFVNRVENYFHRLDAIGVNYANHLYGIEGQVLKTTEGNISYQLATPTDGKTIRYCLNNKHWKEYTAPISIQEDSEIKALVFEQARKLSDTFKQDILYHRGLKANIKLDTEPHPSYAAGGIGALNNGILGSDTRYGDNEWLGFWGDDLRIEISLPELQRVSKIKLRFFNANGQWIYLPKQITATGRIDDRRSFKMTQEIDANASEEVLEVEMDLSLFPPNQTSVISLEVPNYGIIPGGKQGAGNKAWTFIDEIVIE